MCKAGRYYLVRTRVHCHASHKGPVSQAKKLKQRYPHLVIARFCLNKKWPEMTVGEEAYILKGIHTVVDFNP